MNHQFCSNRLETTSLATSYRLADEILTEELCMPAHRVPGAKTSQPEFPISASPFHQTVGQSPSCVKPRSQWRGLRARAVRFGRSNDSTGFFSAADTDLHSLSSALGFTVLSVSLLVRQGQRRDHSQHASEQPPSQMPLGQQQPVLARMFHQPSARLSRDALSGGRHAKGPTHALQAKRGPPASRAPLRGASEKVTAPLRGQDIINQ